MYFSVKIAVHQNLYSKSKFYFSAGQADVPCGQNFTARAKPPPHLIRNKDHGAKFQKIPGLQAIYAQKRPGIQGRIKKSPRIFTETDKFQQKIR